jgi:hypothetical protein
MSEQIKHQHEQAALPAPEIEAANEKLVQEALEKYKELYLYSTDVLLKEQERFNKADEKASKYATMFFFLIGAIAFFDKWIVDKIKWPNFPFSLPPDLPLIVVGSITLIVCAVGLFLAQYAMKLYPLVSRPLNQDILDFFENKTQITIYYKLAEGNSSAYAENKKASDAKYTILKWSYYIMILVFALLAVLVVMYCWYSWR